MSRYTVADIANFRVDAIGAKCTANDLFWTAPLSELVEVCNGFGSEEAAKWERDALTLIFRRYGCVGAIHDCRYEKSDGTEASRRVADEEFRDNAMKMWKKIYGWSRFFRPAARADRAKIKVAYVALRVFGGNAWRDSYRKWRMTEEIDK